MASLASTACRRGYVASKERKVNTGDGSTPSRAPLLRYLSRMPTPHHLKNLGVYGNRYRLAEAAAENLLVAVQCLHCRRAPVLFLASDLVQVLDPNRDCFYPPPFPCSKCGRDDRIEVKLRGQD